MKSTKQWNQSRKLDKKSATFIIKLKSRTEGLNQEKSTMAKVTAPFLSLDASGTIASTITASKWKGINYVRLRVIPQNPQSDPQTAIRTVLTNGVMRWRDAAYVPVGSKSKWETYAAGTGMSGFNRFMRYYNQANYDDVAQEVEDPEVIPTPE